MEAKKSLEARKELLFRMRHRYAVADRKRRSEILYGFVAATGYHRKYAVAVLRHPSNENGSEQLYAHRKRIYDQTVQQALICVWNAANQIYETTSTISSGVCGNTRALWSSLDVTRS